MFEAWDLVEDNTGDEMVGSTLPEVLQSLLDLDLCSLAVPTVGGFWDPKEDLVLVVEDLPELKTLSVINGGLSEFFWESEVEDMLVNKSEKKILSVYGKIFT